MATVDQANVYMAALAGGIDAELKKAAPGMTFALVVWPKKSPTAEGAIGVFCPPAAKRSLKKVMTLVGEEAE